jgi:hypothetical protein
MSPKRRSARADPLEKTGYRIPRSLALRVREAVDAGEAKSQNELVERALRRELRALEKRRLYEEYARAAANPEFMKELIEETELFDNAVGDGLEDEEPYGEPY